MVLVIIVVSYDLLFLLLHHTRKTNKQKQTNNYLTGEHLSEGYTNTKIIYRIVHSQRQSLSFFLSFSGGKK